MGSALQLCAVQEAWQRAGGAGGADGAGRAAPAVPPPPPPLTCSRVTKPTVSFLKACSMACTRGGTRAGQGVGEVERKMVHSCVAACPPLAASLPASPLPLPAPPPPPTHTPLSRQRRTGEALRPPLPSFLLPHNPFSPPPAPSAGARCAAGPLLSLQRAGRAGRGDAAGSKHGQLVEQQRLKMATRMLVFTLAACFPHGSRLHTHRRSRPCQSCSWLRVVGAGAPAAAASSGGEQQRGRAPLCCWLAVKQMLMALLPSAGSRRRRGEAGVQRLGAGERRRARRAKCGP